MKLTKAQRNLLSEVRDTPTRVIRGYKPAVRLVELGCVTQGDTSYWGYVKLTITPAGRAALAEKEGT